VTCVLWLDEAAMAGWQAPRRTTPGGQAWYSDVAVELVLTLRLVFHLALRQAEGFTASVLRLLGQDLRVPDHRDRRTIGGRSVSALNGAAPCSHPRRLHSRSLTGKQQLRFDLPQS
jgi:hypothetical protein